MLTGGFYPFSHQVIFVEEMEGSLETEARLGVGERLAELKWVTEHAAMGQGPSVPVGPALSFCSVVAVS